MILVSWQKLNWNINYIISNPNIKPQTKDYYYNLTNQENKSQEHYFALVNGKTYAQKTENNIAM